MITKTIVSTYSDGNRKTFNFKYNEDKEENERSKIGTGVKGNTKFSLERYADKFVTKNNFKTSLKRTEKYKFEDFVIVEEKEALPGDCQIRKFKFKYIGSEV